MSVVIEEEEVAETLKEAVAEIPDSVPEVKTEEKVAEEEPDFSPLENEKVIAKCLSFHNDVMKLKDASFYRNAGKASYINYIVGPRKSITGMHFSKKSARITMHHTNGKKSTGDTSIKINENGYSTDGESLMLKDIIAHITKYRKARGW